MIKKFLEDNVLITDGAMGTYYSSLTGKDTCLSELANIFEPEIIKKIHKSYIDAGAKLLRTNTFSVNTLTLNISRQEGVTILAGIMPLVSYRNARFINNEVPGIEIPDKYLQRFERDMSRAKAEKTGIEIAVEIVNKVINHVGGLYFVTPFNRVKVISQILNKLNIPQAVDDF